MLVDGSISLFDHPKYDFELNIEPKNGIGMQDMIFYSSLFKVFCTIEHPPRINMLDIANGTFVNSFNIESPYQIELANKKTKNQFNADQIGFIRVFKEIYQLRCLMMATSTQRIILFDVESKSTVVDRVLKTKKITDLIYVKKFRIIIVIVYENSIPIFELDIDSYSKELNFIGRLFGHLGFVLSGNMMEDKDVFTSIDDRAVIKFWDLRNFTCIKTVDLHGSKNSIKDIIYIPNRDFITVISKKMTSYKLEHNLSPASDINDNKTIDLYYNDLKNEIYIFKTQSFIILDASTCQTQSIIYYNKRNEAIKKKIVAAVIRVVNDGHHFYLGDTKGQIYFFDMKFNLIYEIKPHSSEIKGVHINNDDNQMLFTISDSAIYTEYVEKDSATPEHKVLRQLTNMFEGEKKLRSWAVDIDMGVGLVSEGDNCIYVIELEFNKVHSKILLPRAENVTGISTISKYGLIIVYLASNSVLTLEFNYADNINQLTFTISIKSITNLSASISKSELTKTLIQAAPSAERDVYNIYYGYSNGEMMVLLLRNLSEIRVKQSYTLKNSYNGKRIFKSDFGDNTKILKTYTLDFSGNDQDMASSIELNRLLITYDAGKVTDFLQIIKTFKAAPSAITNLRAINNGEKLICVIYDSGFNFYDSTMKSIASFNSESFRSGIWQFVPDMMVLRSKEMEEAFEILTDINRKIESKESLFSMPLELGVLYQNKQVFLTQNQTVKTVHDEQDTDNYNLNLNKIDAGAIPNNSELNRD